MRILAIDPGTRCGWCLGQPGERPVLDAWDLGSRRHEGGGMRFLRLRNYLAELLDGPGTRPDLVVYEEVRRHLGTEAGHIYGGIIAEITAAAEQRKIPYQGVPVQHIKKYATGSGNADKDAVLRAMRARHKRIDVLGYDEADALALWALAGEQFAALAR